MLFILYKCLENKFTESCKSFPKFLFSAATASLTEIMPLCGSMIFL